jgi:hypothetical protein
MNLLRSMRKSSAGLYVNKLKTKKIKTKMKLNVKTYGVLCAMAIATVNMSCEDREVQPAELNPGTGSLTNTHINSVAKPDAIVVDIKSVKLEKNDLGKIQEILKEVDPELYQIEIHENGKIIDRLGSAAIKDLKKVSAYYAEGFGGQVSANEIITTVSDYIKTIWTAQLLESGKYLAQIKKVESILNQNVVRDVRLKTAKLTEGEIKIIHKTLSRIDPSLFQFEFHEKGEVVSRIGSGAISDLRKVGAFYSKDFGKAQAGNEIVTTVSDYIKTIWTAKLLDAGIYEKEIAHIENILNRASQR